MARSTNAEQTTALASSFEFADLVTANEAAQIAGVSTQTVRSWVGRGRLPNRGTADWPLIPRDAIPLIAVAELGDAPPDVGGIGGDLVPSAAAAPSPVAQELARALLIIRETWIDPYVHRIAELSRAQGSLEAQRDAARRQARSSQRRAQALERRLEAEQRERISALAQEIEALRDEVAGAGRSADEIARLRRDLKELRQQVAVAWTALEQEARGNRDAGDASPRPWWRR